MIVSELFSYTIANNTYHGIVAYNSSTTAKRPAIMVVHTWMGQGDFEVQKSKELAQLGYIAFAIDMYGQNRRPANTEEASFLMHECINDRAELLHRINGAYQAIKKHPFVIETKIAAIGFCFGGKCVLDLARSSSEINAVVSFHGIYDKPDLEYHHPISTSILVLHGWEDPLAPPSSVLDLATELTKRKADWSIHAYGHTGHAFTNPNANRPTEGMYFHQLSNDRAWSSMVQFLEEKLK